MLHLGGTPCTPSHPRESDEEDFVCLAADPSEENGEANRTTSELQVDSNKVESNHSDPDDSGSDLCPPAEQRLKAILAQYPLAEPSEVHEAIGTFQDDITACSCDLRLKPIPDKNQDARGSRPPGEVCNEAISERTRGTMHRLGRDLLLSRLTISKHADHFIEYSVHCHDARTYKFGDIIRGVQ
jgi:hypothetical protein